MLCQKGGLFMKKDELIRYRAGLATLLVSGSMFLGGCKESGRFFI